MFDRSISLFLAVLIAGGPLLFSTSTLADGNPAVSAKEIPWFPTVEFGGKTGTKRHVWETDITIPVLQDEDSLVFLDLRGRIDDDGSEEGNLGLGWRRIVHDGEGIFGVYGFYDVLHSGYNNTYHQGTLGTEYLWSNFELRGNAYVPERGARNAIGASGGAHIVGNQIFVSEGREEAMPGFDVEAGLLVPGTDDLWLRAALFHFSADDEEQNVTGPRLSAEWGVDLGHLFRGTELTLGGEWQNDDIRGSQAFASARLRIPLGPAPTTRGQAPSWHYNRMQEKIRRDIDIVVAQGAKPGAAMHPGTGEAVSGIYFADGDADSGAAGTFEDPTDLYNALELAGENGIVVALGGDGDIEFGSATVYDGEKLAGGGSSIILAGGHQYAPLMLPGSRPNLVSEDGLDLEDGTGNQLFKGFDMETDSTSIYGFENHDVRFEDVNLTSDSGSAIHLEDVSGSVALLNSTLSASSLGLDASVDGADAAFQISGNSLDAGDSGIRVYVQDAVADVLIQDNVIDAGAGIDLWASSTSAAIDAVVSGNEIDAGGSGVYAYAYYGGSVDAMITDNVINASDGVYLSAYSTSASIEAEISGNEIDASDTGVYAYAYYASSVDAMITDNVINASDGIEVTASSTSAYINAEISGNEINADDDGIIGNAYYYDASVDLVIADNVINASDGIYLSAYSSSAAIDAEISGNEINAEDTGIEAEADSDYTYIELAIVDNVINAEDGIYLSADSSSAYITAEISGNEITATDTGIEVWAEDDYASVNVLIEDNVINAYDGIELSASSDSASVIADVLGNEINAEETGIYAYAEDDEAYVNVRIEDNVINAYDGIYLSAYSSSAEVNAEISGNEINAEETGIYAYAEYEEAYVDVQIQDNVINAYDGIYLSAYSSSAAIDAEISGNEVNAEDTGIEAYAYDDYAAVDILIEDNVIIASDGIYLSVSASSSESSGSAEFVAEITGNTIVASDDDIVLNGYSDSEPMQVNACLPELSTINAGADVDFNGWVEADGDTCSGGGPPVE